MEGTLSASEQRLIVDLCDGFRSWSSDETQPPQLVDVLAGGHSNRVVLLRGKRDYVLRLAKGSPPDDVCRRRERQAHSAAAAAGLAPAIRYVDEQRGTLVTDYACASPTLDLKALGALLRGIHALPVNGSPLLLQDRLDYWAGRRRADSGTSALLQQKADAYHKVCEIAAELDGEVQRGQAVLCHNDLLSANRRCINGRLVAIDWEYARPGNGFFDLAVCASELVPAQRDEVLEHYLQRPPSHHDRRQLLGGELIYAVIAASWYECSVDDEDHPAIAEARNHLASLLNAVSPHD